MKKAILLTAFTFIAMASFSQFQQKKPDSLVLEIKMDTATWKSVIQLINENINGNSLTGKMVLQNILAPLYQYALVPREKLAAKKEDIDTAIKKAIEKTDKPKQ